MAKKKSKSKKRRIQNKRSSNNRKSAKAESLQYQNLEPRQLLASVTVGTPTFVEDGDTTSILSLINSPGADGAISLPEAITATNNSVGSDIINFSFADTTIRFPDSRSVQLFIYDSLTINGNGNTISGSRTQAFSNRVFNITPEGGAFSRETRPGNMDVSLFDLTVTGGRTNLDSDFNLREFAGGGFNDTSESGGNIRFNSEGTLTLENSSVLNGRTGGAGASGGGIFAVGQVVLTNSRVSNNTTGVQTPGIDGTDDRLSNGLQSLGGGIYSQTGVTLFNSSVDNNKTLGDAAPGGGIASPGDVIVNASIVRDNSTAGQASYGGGIYSGGILRNPDFVLFETPIDELFIAGSGNVEVSGGSVFGNSTNEASAKGGGIFANDVRLTNTLVTGNSTNGRSAHGGGVYAVENLVISNSTLESNHTNGGVSSQEAFACDVGLFLANEVLSRVPGVGRIVSYFNKINSVLGLADTDICGDRGGGALGGGAFARSITVTSSDILDNFTDGNYSDGGALFALNSVAIENSTVRGNSTRQGASRGGAISAPGFQFEDNILYGNVTIQNSEFVDNLTYQGDSSGGAINGGLVRVNDSIFRNNQTNSADSPGGAIFSRSVINVANSQFSVNRTFADFDLGYGQGDSPGGALAGQNVIVNDSTFDSNQTRLGDSNGGAIFAQYQARITNSTFANNAAVSSSGGAIYASLPEITHSSFANNYAEDQGGSVFTPNEITFINSIAVDSEVSDGFLGFGRANNDLEANGIRFSGQNVVSAPVGNTTGSSIPVPGSFVFGSDPITLENNNGRQAGRSNNLQTVQTIRLRRLGPGFPNPAVDATNFSDGDFDQRGFSRGLDDATEPNTGGTIDLGAVETSDVSDLDPLRVTTSSLSSSFNTVSLPEAIEFANNNPGFDVITFDRSLSGQTILLQGEDLDIADSVSIDASNLQQPLTIRGGESGSRSRIFEVLASNIGFSTALSLNNLVLTNGRVTDDLSGGGAILSRSTAGIRLINTEVRANFALGGGGGIKATGGVALYDGSSVVNNGTLNNYSNRNSDGGGINASAVVLRNSTVQGNYTNVDSSDGGGIFSSGDVQLFDGSIVQLNRTNREFSSGGGIRALGAVLIAGGSTVQANSTNGESSEGGGIHADEVRLQGSTVQGNSTNGESSDGGGIRANYVVIADSTISGNTTNEDFSFGGGIFAGTSSVTNSVIENNETFGVYASGGGIAGGEFTVTNTTIRDNQTNGTRSTGGGISATFLTLTNSVLSGNSTNSTNADGGGAFVRNEAIISNSTIAANRTGSTSSDGGGLHVGSLTLTNSTVTGNTTASGLSNDGGIRVVGTADVTNSIIVGNYSSSNNNPSHEISAGTLNQFGSNLIGNNTISSLTAEQIFTETEVAQIQSGTGTTPNSSGRRAGVLTDNGGSQLSIALSPSAGNPAIDGTVAPESLFSFEGNANDGFANNNGTLVGGLTADAEGFQGSGIEFTGNANQFVQLSDPLTIGDKSHTIEVWVKIPEVGTGGLANGERVGELLGSFGSSPNANWGILADGQIQVFWNNGQVRLRGTTDLRDNQWHQLTFVRDTVADEFRAYIDGEVEALDGAGGNANSAGLDIIFDTPHRIGLDNRTSAPVPFHGTVDELSIHERALTPEEIMVRAGAVDLRGTGFDRIAAADDAATGSTPQLDIGAFEANAPDSDSLIVTTFEDVVDNRDGVTSLREAIIFANSGDADGVNGLADTITFDPDLQGETIVLINGSLDIQQSLDIVGLENTIDANLRSRALLFSSQAGDLRLESLAFENGRVEGGSGGAIQSFSLGNLTLDNSRISSNSVTGSGQVGGAISASGNVILNNSLIDNNLTDGQIGHGGGVYSLADVEINNSTITQNVTRGVGSNGGGVFARGNLSLTNSTIVGNRATGQLSVGGGLSAPDLNIQNSIILGNEILAEGDFTEINFTNTPTFGGQNIVGEDSAGFNIGSLTNVINAKLGDVFTSGLLEDRSDFILAIPLTAVAANPALDAGDNSLAATIPFDSRGELRNVDLNAVSNLANQTIDLGAYELQTTGAEESSLVVTTSIDVVDEFDFQTSLREAIAFADSSGGAFNSTTGVFDLEGAIADTVTFASGPGEHFSVPRTITLVGQDDIDVTWGLTIDGTGTDQLTIDGNFESGIFDLNSTPFFEATNFSAPGEQRFTLRNLTLANGAITGAVRVGNRLNSNSPQTLTLDNVVLRNNSSESAGGAISAARSVVTIRNSALVNNVSEDEGSAISLARSSANISNSTISGNSSYSGNGAIYQSATNSETENLSLQNVTLANNDGFGIQTFAGNGSTINLSIGNSILADNTESNLSTNGTTNFTSLGGNVSDESIAGLSSSDDRVVSDAMLNPLDDATFTQSLDGNSPAVDFGNNAISAVLSRPISVTSDTINDLRPVGNLISNDDINIENFQSTTETLANSFVTAASDTPDFFAEQQVIPQLVFDLGGLKSLSDVVIYGLIDAMNDVKDFTLEFSIDGGRSYNSELQFTKSIYSSSNFVNILSFGVSQVADFVRMTITDNHGGNRVGFQEIRFLETADVTDQRGGGFNRIVDGDSNGIATIDAGATELEFADPFVLGDANLDGTVNFLDISPFISLLSSGTFLDEADVNRDGSVDFLDISPFISVLSGGSSTATSQSIVSSPPVSSAVSVVSNSEPKPIVLVASNVEAPSKVEVPLTIETSPAKKINAAPATASQSIVATAPLPQAPLVLATDSLDSATNEPSKLAAMDRTLAGVTPVDTYSGPVEFAPANYRFLGARNSSLRGSEGDGPLVEQRSLTGNVESIDFSLESHDTRSLASESIEESFSTAAELFDAHPESLDEVFDFDFEETLAGLI